MDNIQKALITVLGVAGMIAMLVPAKDPIASASSQPVTVAKPVEIATAPVAQAPIAAPIPQSENQQENSLDIGQPAIDGNPIQPDFGMPYGGSAPEPVPFPTYDFNSSNGAVANNQSTLPSPIPQAGPYPQPFKEN
jgi:hypothetical protein